MRVNSRPAPPAVLRPAMPPTETAGIWKKKQCQQRKKVLKIQYGYNLPGEWKREKYQRQKKNVHENVFHFFSLPPHRLVVVFPHSCCFLILFALATQRDELSKRVAGWLSGWVVRWGGGAVGQWDGVGVARRQESE